MIIESWEIRYFSKGTLPVDIQQWVEENSLVSQPVRTDHYLLRATKENGTKWREGTLQVKYLVDTFAVSENQEGEHYKKWSFELKDDDPLKAIETHADWIGVSKKRDMAKWTFDGHGFHRTDPGNHEESGIELEISAIMCKEQLWWTIAFEATGSKNTLIKAIEKIDVPLPHDALAMGYAQWIQEFYTKE